MSRICKKDDSMFQILNGVVILLIGVILFMMGHHNVDLMVNALKYSYDYGMPFNSMCDLNSAGRCMGFVNVYIQGRFMEFMGLIISIAGSWWLGMTWMSSYAKLMKKRRR